MTNYTLAEIAKRATIPIETAKAHYATEPRDAFERAYNFSAFVLTKNTDDTPEDGILGPTISVPIKTKRAAATTLLLPIRRRPGSSLALITIGRAANSDIRIEDVHVSKFHASVKTIEGILFFEDHHSTNGTLINGQPLPMSTARALTNGDTLILGGKDSRAHLMYFGQEALPAYVGYLIEEDRRQHKD